MLPIVDRWMDRLCKRKRLVHYVRYMDNIVLLARTRWELRRAIVALYEEIAALGLRLHRVKRFIGIDCAYAQPTKGRLGQSP